MIGCPLCAAKDRRIEELEERVASLEHTDEASWAPPIEWGLTGKEAQLVAGLLKRDVATKMHLMNMLYGDKPDSDIAEEKIIDVFVCKVRKKLEPFGVKIETVWGQGYAIPKAVRDDVLSGRGAA